MQNIKVGKSKQRRLKNELILRRSSVFLLQKQTSIYSLLQKTKIG